LSDKYKRQSLERGKLLGHVACNECGSSDAVAVYEQSDGSKNGYCWSACSGTKDACKSQEQVEGKPFASVSSSKPKEPITHDQMRYVESITGFCANKYRGIPDNVLKFTGIRTELDEDDNIVARYYPAHELLETGDAGSLVGFKRRFHPKDFSKGSIGRFGQDCALLGMNIHRKGCSKKVLICAGEEDYLAAVTMLRRYQVSRGLEDKEPMAVVSPLTGETGSVTQVKNNIAYLDSFDEIVIGYDNDEKGREAALKVADVLPADKVFIAEWPLKDINEMLQQGQQAQFLDCYYKAKPFSPSSIKESATHDFLNDAIDRAKTPKIPLPDFFKDVSDMLCGGFPLGYWINLASGSGTGKSTIVNELVYDWIRRSPHLVGIISLEALASEYYTNLLSRHIGRKIELISDPEEKVRFLQSSFVREKSEELRIKEDGSSRFVLLDDRGDVASIKKNIIKMITVHGVKVIIIDVLSDVMDELSTEDAAKFSRWMKQLLQRYEVSIVCVNHTRKASNGQKAASRGADLNEEDISGTSTIFKSGGINLITTRDKLAECPIQRNTIKVSLTKNRSTGITGVAGYLYYDNKTHTLHRLTEELKAQLISEQGLVEMDEDSFDNMPEEAYTATDDKIFN
jgi:twinkle protein